MSLERRRGLVSYLSLLCLYFGISILIICGHFLEEKVFKKSTFLSTHLSRSFSHFTEDSDCNNFVCKVPYREPLCGMSLLKSLPWPVTKKPVSEWTTLVRVLTILSPVWRWVTYRSLPTVYLLGSLTPIKNSSRSLAYCILASTRQYLTEYS